MKRCSVLTFALVLIGTAFARVDLHPAPQVRTCAPLAVKVNGRSVEVIAIPAPDHCLKGAEAQPYSAVLFEADETVEVEVSGPAMRHVAILPKSRGIRPEIVSANAMRFRAKPPFTVAVEPSGRHGALIVSANVPDPDPPKPDDPGVVYIGPGSHYRPETLRLTSNQTLYLAPGAYLESAVCGRGTNITVCGRGILSGSPWAHECGPKGGGRMAVFSGKDITIRDVTLMSSYNWTLVVSGEDILVDNVRILNGRVLNDDGIDVVQARRTTIRNCFIRAQDDCITPKWWCEDLLVENCALWTDVANIFRIGYECQGSNTFYRNFTIRDIDVLHQSIHKVPMSDDWAENTFFIQCGNDQRFEDFLIENVRFDAPEPGDNFLNMRTFKVHDPWQNHKLPGHFRNLTVRNVHVSGGQMPNTLGVRLASMDSERRIEGVRFENVSGLGDLSIVGDVRGVNLPPESFRAFRTWEAGMPPLGDGTVWVEVTPESEPKGAACTTAGLRLETGKGTYWGISLLRRPGVDGVPGDHAFEFEYCQDWKRFAPIGRCLFSRTRGGWTCGQTYRLALHLDARGVYVAVFDAAGIERFAEKWLFTGAEKVRGGTPRTYTWNGLAVRFGAVRHDSDAK